MDKEQVWLRKRLGMITASELGNITSASGKIIDGNITYIRAKRFERKHGFTHPVSSRTMDIGHEQEPMIFEWCKKNFGRNDIVYSKNLPEIPFWIATDCPVGASPDAFSPDMTEVYEFKTLVGATAIEFFADDYVKADNNTFYMADDARIFNYIFPLWEKDDFIKWSRKENASSFNYLSEIDWDQSL